jgi:hypothetical protein
MYVYFHFVAWRYFSQAVGCKSNVEILVDLTNPSITQSSHNIKNMEQEIAKNKIILNYDDDKRDLLTRNVS